MSPLFILLPLTLVGMIAAGFAFVWAVRSDQFEDMDGPAHQILFDEEIRPIKEVEEEKRRAEAVAKAAAQEDSLKD